MCAPVQLLKSQENSLEFTLKIIIMVHRICIVNLGKQIGADLVFTRQQRAIHTTAIQSGLLRRYFRSILSFPRERRMSPPWKHCTQIGESRTAHFDDVFF